MWIRGWGLDILVVGCEGLGELVGGLGAWVPRRRIQVLDREVLNVLRILESRHRNLIFKSAVFQYFRFEIFYHDLDFSESGLLGPRAWWARIGSESSSEDHGEFPKFDFAKVDDHGNLLPQIQFSILHITRHSLVINFNC